MPDHQDRDAYTIWFSKEWANQSLHVKRHFAVRKTVRAQDTSQYLALPRDCDSVRVMYRVYATDTPTPVITYVPRPPIPTDVPWNFPTQNLAPSVLAALGVVLFVRGVQKILATMEKRRMDVRTTIKGVR